MRGAVLPTTGPVHAVGGAALHPRNILLGAQASRQRLPVCDHYSGVEARIRKSLQLQTEFMEEFGVCVFDVTLDCEDGAPVGGEFDHANMVVAHVNTARAASNLIANQAKRRMGVRVHAVDHPAFASDVETVIGKAGGSLNYLMVPKVESLAQVERAIDAMDAAASPDMPCLPLHVLIESPLATHRAFEIASHPRVESMSFGLMDFVSAHGGAVPVSAMGMGDSPVSKVLDQFHHPLVLRAKLDIASACHAYGKVPSHCVVTEYQDVQAIETAARTASQAFGFTRMWSIHPTQIRPILRAFAPEPREIDLAAEIILAAQSQQWAPIAVAGRLHDRASYRYFWQVLERANQTGCDLPDTVCQYFPTHVH